MYMTVLNINYDTMKEMDENIDYSNMNSIHQWLTGRFHKSRKDAHILFKFITMGKDLKVYIQSDDPFPAQNIEKAGAKLISCFELPKVKAGDTILFRINCSADKYMAGKKNSEFITDSNERVEWLKRKTDPAMEILNIQELQKSRYISEKTDKKTGKLKKTKIQFIEYMGMACVSDPESFMEMIHNGIGRFKNYGLGMLLYNVA